MKLLQSSTIIILVFLSLTACHTVKEIQPLTHNNLHSTLFIQTSAEYRANMLQTYRAATGQLDSAIADTSWRAMLEQTGSVAELPTAIVLDVDETVLDNSPYQAMMIKTGSEFDINVWDEWVIRAEAKALPGAVEFINAAIDRGVEVIYLTNRECIKRNDSNNACPQSLRTAQNLRDVGIKEVKDELVLLKYAQSNWTSEKKSRRDYLTDKFRVIMLFGDDLGDFLPNVKSDITYQQRAALVDQHSKYWGTHWFALPNPTYGSWQRVLSQPRDQHLIDY